jgi:Ankyrin repeats (3 copies)
MARSTNHSLQLLSAIHKGSVSDSMRLLAAGADPNATDKYDLTALMWAARKGNAELVSLLLSRGADLDRADRRRRTALHHAVALKRSGTLKELIAGGSTLDVKDMYGKTPLQLANLMDEYELSRILLEAGAQGEVPDPGDLSIGMVSGGPEETPVRLVVVELMRRVAAARRPNPWREKGHLNVVFHLPGSVLQTSFLGIQTGTFSRVRRVFMVQAAPISTAYEAVERGVLVEMVREAIALADKRFRKAKIEFLAALTREWFDRLVA